MTIHPNIEPHDAAWLGGAASVPIIEMSPLTPDRAALAAFTAAVFKNADPKGFVSTRIFLDDGNEGPAI